MKLVVVKSYFSIFLIPNYRDLRYIDVKQDLKKYIYIYIFYAREDLVLTASFGS